MSFQRFNTHHEFQRKVLTLPKVQTRKPIICISKYKEEQDEKFQTEQQIQVENLCWPEMIHQSCTFQAKNSFAKGGKTRINGIAQLNRRRVSELVTDYEEDKNKENQMKNEEKSRKRKGIFHKTDPSLAIIDIYD